MQMFYGEGRLFGNTGVYVVEQAQDAWDAERLIRNATATREQVQLPKLTKVTPENEEAMYDVLESVDDPTLRKRAYKLGYGVVFFEFADMSDFELV